MNNIGHPYAPVALFVYNRLENTRQVIEALAQNDLAPETDLIIYSDGPKTERDAASVQTVRDYLKSITGFRSVKVVERPENYYIERNITEGVRETVNQYGKIIVLEDDGVSAKNFLTFMNNALDFYERYQKVMHIAAFTFIDLPQPAGQNKTFLWRYSENTGGGWATWKDRWHKFTWFQSEQEGLSGLSEAQKNKIELDGAFPCLNNLKLKPIPWDICWYIAITKNDGLAVNSPKALVRNNGLFNGTHFSALNKLLGKNPFEVELDETGQAIQFENNLTENAEAISLLKEFYQSIGNRKRDKILGLILKPLVALKITRLFKRLLK